MDLVGIDVKKRRQQAKITILTRKDGNWSDEEINKLVAAIQIKIINQHPQHPDKLMIYGDYSKEKLALAIGKNDFECQVFQGWDNPELPFKVPTF